MKASTRLETLSTCPECKGEVKLAGRVMIGEVFGCARCGAQLEVAGVEPLVLEPMAKVEEDEEDLQGFDEP